MRPPSWSRSDSGHGQEATQGTGTRRRGRPALRRRGEPRRLAAAGPGYAGEYGAAGLERWYDAGYGRGEPEWRHHLGYYGPGGPGRPGGRRRYRPFRETRESWLGTGRERRDLFEYDSGYDWPRRRPPARRAPGTEAYDESFGPGPDRARRWRFPEALAERYRPHKTARGFPVRGIHTYDMDYGRQGGGPAEYSGRAGLPTGEPRGPAAEALEPAEWPYSWEPTEERETFTRRRPRYEEWHWSTAEPADQRPRRRRRRSERY